MLIKIFFLYFFCLDLKFFSILKLFIKELKRKTVENYYNIMFYYNVTRLITKLARKKH